MSMQAKLSRPLSLGEEIANSITHGIGSLTMLILLPISAIYAYHYYDMQAVVGITIFIISLFLMFLSSTVYHSMTYGSKQKYILRIIDHSMIFIAIAGSYTPIALSVIGGWQGYAIIVVQWLIALFGILYKIFAKTMNQKLSLTIYLMMGWMVVFIAPILIERTQLTFLILMVFGGLSYTVGAIFYAQKKPYMHMIWHLFILLASLLQYIAIVFYMF